jgi:hypothetical protein
VACLSLYCHHVKTRGRKKKLTDADGQLSWSPSTIGLAVAVGSSDQIESGRAVIGHTTAECVAFAFVSSVGYVGRLTARSSLEEKISKNVSIEIIDQDRPPNKIEAV